MQCILSHKFCKQFHKLILYGTWSNSELIGNTESLFFKKKKSNKMSFCKESPTLGVRRFFHLQNFGTKVLTKSHCVKCKMWIKIRKKCNYRRRMDYLKGCNQHFTTILILAHLRSLHFSTIFIPNMEGN